MKEIPTKKKLLLSKKRHKKHIAETKKLIKALDYNDGARKYLNDEILIEKVTCKNINSIISGKRRIRKCMKEHSLRRLKKKSKK